MRDVILETFRFPEEDEQKEFANLAVRKCQCFLLPRCALGGRPVAQPRE